MPILDFKEIPEAHKGGGLQDTFELFCRDFLKFMGFLIVRDPHRGADGGVDLIVEEKRTGVGGETVVRWLVSCKHKAHSGASVTPTDESNITDRIVSNGCNGFIGFYSTLCSSGLSDNLEGIKRTYENTVFDKEKIEGKLLFSAEGLRLASRFFPTSIENWKSENPEPARLFLDEPSLLCDVCGKNLLSKKDKGIITCWQSIREDYKTQPKKIELIKWTCRGHCDDKLSAWIREMDGNLIDGWEDIGDVTIPTVFLKWIMASLNEQRSGVQYSDQAFEKLKEFMIQVFPYISRDLTEKEKERLNDLSSIPECFGGFG